MTQAAKILVQTTIAHDPDDWHVGRFSMLCAHLAGLRTETGVPRFEVVARDRDCSTGPDPVLSRLDQSAFAALWLLGVDAGGGLDAADCAGIGRFQRRGGGLLVTRDHMELGHSVCGLDRVGLAHYFHTTNPDPDATRHCIDDRGTAEILWPNYYSGANGDFQEIEVLAPVHPVLIDPEAAGGLTRFLPAHPHEGGIGVPPGSGARVIARGTSKASGRPFNIAVAFEASAGAGPALAQSTFHHFADYNWDPSAGCPRFVTEAPGSGFLRSAEAVRSTRRYTANLAAWLTQESGVETEAQRLERALDEALDQSFPASDPLAIW